jgi:hypothetical protein
VSLPTAYLTSTKNLEGILMAMQNAQAPPRFTQAFLENLGYASSSDRLVINVLKALGFLTASGEPTDRYIRYLDSTQSGRVLAEGIKEAYSDLFRVNIKAQEMPRNELKGKIKVLTQGKLTDAVVHKMAITFEALAKYADWTASGGPPPPDEIEPDEDGGDDRADEDDGDDDEDRGRVRLGGLVYNIQIQLPESRDQAVYDALFKSLKAHLLR